MSSHLSNCLDKKVDNVYVKPKQFCEKLGNLPPSIVRAVFNNGGRNVTTMDGIRLITKLVMEEIGREYDGKA